MTRDEFEALPILTAEDCVDGTVYANTPSSSLTLRDKVTNLAADEIWTGSALKWCREGEDHRRLISRGPSALRVGDRLTAENARSGVEFGDATRHEDGWRRTLVKHIRGTERDCERGATWDFAKPPHDLVVTRLPEEPAKVEGNAVAPHGMGCCALAHVGAETIPTGARCWNNEGSYHFHCLACGPAKCARSCDGYEGGRPISPEVETVKASDDPRFAPGDKVRLLRDMHAATVKPAPVAWDGMPSRQEPRRWTCPCHGYPRCTVYDYEQAYRPKAEVSAQFRGQNDDGPTMAQAMGRLADSIAKMSMVFKVTTPGDPWREKLTAAGFRCLDEEG